MTLSLLIGRLMEEGGVVQMKSADMESQRDNDWSALQPGQLVSFQHDKYLPISGVMEARTDDGSVMWVRMNDGAGRRLIHREDGYRLAPAGEQD